MASREIPPSHEENPFPSGLSALIAANPAVLDAIPAAVYVCDTEGLLVRYNRRAAELWGREPRLRDPTARFCGSLRLFYTDGQPLAHDRCPMAVAVRTGEEFHDLEVMMERPDGQRITALVNIRPLLGKDGRLEGAINCFQNISKSKALERELRESRADLEDFFENAAVPLHIVASDGTILGANQAELDLLGYKREEYLGRHIAEFHADAEAISDILARLSRGESLKSYPARLRAKDGSVRHVLITSNGRRHDDRLRSTRCFSLDVTDRVRMEEALRDSERRARELVQALPVAVYTTDASGRITFHNSAAAELWGRDPIYGPEGESWCGSWRLFSPDGSPLAHDQCPMAQALRSGIPIRNAEAGAERPDGTRVPFLAFPTPLRDPESGELIGAVNTLVDITERKRNETRLHVLVDELNHRVKNTLATVQAIASQTLRGATSVDTFGRSFQARLMALSKTHDLLTGNHWEGAELRQLLLQELAPYVVAGPDEDSSSAAPQVRLSGPEVLLRPREAVALGMVFHELTTNAIKHGALSSTGGSVAVCWQLDEAADTLHLQWLEHGGPPVAGPPTRRGFGTRVVEATLRDQLGGSLERLWNAEGLVCRTSLPLPRRGGSQAGLTSTEPLSA